MAIKTTLAGETRRIITKVVGDQRRVSCSCCEQGCCMYPAIGLGGPYSSEDLPDEVAINWTGKFVGVASRSGDQYENETITLSVVDNKWTLKDTSTNPETVRVVGDCLIRGDGNLTQGNDLAEDQFADTYTVYVNGLADVFDETFTVVRRSLCVWSSSVDEGDPSGVILTPPQLFSEKWVVIVGGEAQTKDDPQNTPVGLYGDQGTEVSET